MAASPVPPFPISGSRDSIYVGPAVSDAGVHIGQHNRESTLAAPEVATMKNSAMEFEVNELAVLEVSRW